MVVRLLPRPQRTTRLWVPGDPSGLPRNGLVGLYDPYRDTYGRNVLPVGAETITIGSGWDGNNITCTAGVCRETEVEGMHYLRPVSPVSIGVTATFQIEVKPDGRDYVLILPVASGAGYGRIRVNLLTGAVTVDYWSNEHYEILGSWAQVLPDGYVRCGISYYNKNGVTGIPGIRACLDDGTYIYMGDPAKGYLLRNPQLNLGPTLFPYSTPSGAPGTLQTLTDFSGRGNTGTLGASTSAGADDPSFTGTALSFGGDDFVLVNGLRDALKGKTQCTLYFVAQRGATTDAVLRPLIGGWGATATDNGMGLFDRLTSADSLSFSIGDGTNATTASLSSGRLPQTPTLVTARFIGGVEVALKRSAEAWTKTTASVVANIKSSIASPWYLSRYVDSYFIGNIFGVYAYDIAHGDSTVARVEQRIRSEFAGRGVTVA